jgi:hypothetical protein
MKQIPEELRGENDFLPSILQAGAELSQTKKLDKIMKMVQENMRAI